MCFRATTAAQNHRPEMVGVSGIIPMATISCRDNKSIETQSQPKLAVLNQWNVPVE